MTFIREFIRCVKAIYAFGVGYKTGERYLLGSLLAAHARNVDEEAWRLGYDLSVKRYKAY